MPPETPWRADLGRQATALDRQLWGQLMATGLIILLRRREGGGWESKVRGPGGDSGVIVTITRAVALRRWLLRHHGGSDETRRALGQLPRVSPSTARPGSVE